MFALRKYQARGLLTGQHSGFSDSHRPPSIRFISRVFRLTLQYFCFVSSAWLTHSRTGAVELQEYRLTASSSYK